jgi:hypothetical protein
MQVDVIRCRFNQFLENVHELPIFCGLDDIRPAQEGVLGDYSFVHRVRMHDTPVQKILPYWGAGWYWRAEVEWMLDVGTLVWTDIIYTLTASAHVPPSSRRGCGGWTTCGRSPRRVSGRILSSRSTP